MSDDTPEDSEAGLPPILKLAMQDVQAVRMVEDAGLQMNVTALNALPVGGRIRHAPENWAVVAPRDSFVYNIVTEGFKIDFVEKPPLPMNFGNPPTDPEGQEILDQEVSSMQAKGVVRSVPGNRDGVVSPFFARPKSTPGKWRPILSMKQVNKYIRYVKFKMTTVRDIQRWLQPDFFMTSLDLSDAYFSIPLHKTVYKFVRFVWRDVTYEYMTNMFGMGPSARLFTKVLAPVVRFLRKALDAQVAGYIDDFLQQDEEKERCAQKTRAAIIIFFCLGFKVNSEKSEIVPNKKIAHLGFEWDTRNMVVTLPAKKVDKLKERAAQVLQAGGVTVRGLQSLLGQLEATKPAVSIAPLHFRFLQALLPKNLEARDRNTFLPLNEQARRDLMWWMTSMGEWISSPLSRGQYSLTLRTDASGLWGWGGHSDRGATQGTWVGSEASWHVNMKELEAGRRSLEEQMIKGDHVLLEMDSAVAVAFINRMGGTRSAPLRDKALQLWQMVLERQGWVTARWLPREQNQVADLLSKESLLKWEFGLKAAQMDMIKDMWGQPSMDLFASSRFHVTPRYCSLEADPKAERLDAFRMARWPHWSYAFPPLPLLDMTLDKIRADRIKAVVVLPRWTEAFWWRKVENMMDGEFLQLGWYKDVLQNLPPEKLPRLGPLIALLLNGEKSHLGKRPRTS